MSYYSEHEEVSHESLVNKANDLMEEHKGIGFGPGHVVIMDYNWNCCDFCLDEIEKVRNGEEQSGGGTHGCSPAQLNAAEKFIKYVKRLYDEDLIAG